MRCDNSLLVELTGFVPEIELELGLRQTIDWFLNVEKPFDYDVKYNGFVGAFIRELYHTNDAIPLHAPFFNGNDAVPIGRN